MAIAAKSVNQPTIGPATGSVGAKQYNTNDKANRTGNNSQYVIMNFFISWIFTKIIKIVNYDRERMIRYCVRVYLKKQSRSRRTPAKPGHSFLHNPKIVPLHLLRKERATNQQ